ncbi:MAG: intradiol ring-cleavage dioxygenase [Pyrinomonadaceae bacterium]
MLNILENRREFLQQLSMAAVAVPFLIGCRAETFAQNDSAILRRIKQNALPTGGEWSGAIDAPADVSWKTTLAKATDEGEPMIISGTIFAKESKTPAPNILIYLYHTDMYGIYGRSGQHRHGKFRGWMLTDDKGRYEFRSIRPASYPNSTQSQHVHMTLTSVDHNEDWIDSILFEGDKFITTRERGTAGKKGGFNPIVTLEKGSNGIFSARRDIQLS